MGAYTRVGAYSRVALIRSITVNNEPAARKRVADLNENMVLVPNDMTNEYST